MEVRIINKLRKTKRLIKQIYKNIIREVDFKSENMIDSTTLNTLTNLSKIDEEIIDIIYEFLDSKNS